MTPRDWHYLIVELDENVPAAWYWHPDGNAIVVEGDALSLTITAHKGVWWLECNRRVRGGPGYYDPPEWRHEYDYEFKNHEDVVTEVDNWIREERCLIY